MEPDILIQRKVLCKAYIVKGGVSGGMEAVK